MIPFVPAVVRQANERRFGVFDKADPPAEQQGPIANAAIGTEVATINAILAALRAYGLIKT